MLIETQLPGIVNHADMNGLANDDHTQYVLADGSRAMESCYVNTTLYCEDLICVSSVTCGDITTGANGDVTIGDGGHLIMDGGTGELSWDINRLTLISNNTMLISSYYEIDIVSSDDVRIVSDYVDVEISAPTGFVKISDLYAPDGIEFDTYGSENISSSTGDMFYSAYFGHNFDSVNGDPLRSMTGFASGDGNAGITTNITYSNGFMVFEDGLLVFETVF